MNNHHAVNKFNINLQIHFPKILLILVFLLIFFLKAYFYGAIPEPLFISFFNNTTGIAFYLLIFFYWLFVFPPFWIMFSGGGCCSLTRNYFIDFAVDIFMTVIWLSILYFVVRSVVKLIRRKRKKPTLT